MNQLSVYLKEYRRTSGYTQGRFAKLIGVSPSYLSKVERGRLYVPDNLLPKTSRELKAMQFSYSGGAPHDMMSAFDTPVVDIDEAVRAVCFKVENYVKERKK